MSTSGQHESYEWSAELQAETTPRRQTLELAAPEQVEDPDDRRTTGPVVVYCECDHPGCDEQIELDSAEYAVVRRRPSCYILTPGHDKAAIERVVEAHPSFLLTEPIL